MDGGVCVTLKSDYYTIILKTVGPVYVGSGKSLSKKEYIYDRRKKKVIIPCFEKMYTDIQKSGLEKDFQKYMLGDNRMTLEKWLAEHGFLEKDYSKWTQYELDCGDAIIEKGKMLEIRTFMKDGYGMAYFPGSSLKGALRTCLLAADIMNHEKYARISHEVEQSVSIGGKRNTFLDKERRKLETECYHLLLKSEKKTDMVNDIMSGIIVSDSNPIENDNLVLCQKIEMHADGNEKRLNLLRECIKPGTEIHFGLEITREAKEAGITNETIMEAIKLTGNLYYDMFVSKFSKTKKSQENTIWIGGGSGFHTKTVINALFKGNDRKAVALTSDILYNTIGNKIFKMHKHDKDKANGISPHILKVTKYCGRTYQMGSCRVKIEEKQF